MIPPLTSGLFAFLTIALAIVLPTAVVVTARLWRARTGAWPWVGHSALVILAQAAAVLAVLVWVNNQYGLYASWDDLFGITPPASAASFNPTQQKAVTPSGAPSSTAPTVKRIPWVNGVPQGFTRDSNPNTFATTVHVPGSGVPLPAYVMLPKQYFEARYAKTQFPVLIMLPGYPGTPEALLHRMQVQQRMQQSVSSGGTPFVLVMTQESIPGSPDLECMDLPKQPQIATYLTRELPNIVMTHFRVRTDRTGWGIMGYSEGGYCAAQLTMRFPHLFSAAVSIAGYPRPESPYFANLPKSYTDAGDLALLLAKRPPIALLATESTQDRQAHGVFTALVHVQAPTIVKTVLFHQGGHNTQAFANELAQDFRWISDHMARI